ncbi:hypothetical protein ACFQNE_00485 [Gordonia phosphorivorans]|uniref:GlsB/YeaQ/YmgE family stress response membrane protein n=1 Tax=Gordonia phosphorivorans TaxID=1056982 RepID=A0ABV6H7E7_9ACTN
MAVNERRTLSVAFWVLLVIVVLAVLGFGTIVGWGWSLLVAAVVGLVLGGLARLLVRGTSGMSWMMTILAGLIGSLLGGLIAGALDLGGILEFIVSLLVAAGAIALLLASGIA